MGWGKLLSLKSGTFEEGLFNSSYPVSEEKKTFRVLREMGRPSLEKKGTG